jgi:CRISPR-associated protein Csc3
MNDPADVMTKTGGDRLRDHLDWLEIRKTLVYHRLRDCRGLLTNQIHNAVVSFACEIGWEPILYFAQGAVYLTSHNPVIPDNTYIQKTFGKALFKVMKRVIKGD